MSSDSTTTDNTTVSVADEVFIKLDDTNTHTKTVRIVLNNFLSEIKENDEDEPEESDEDEQEERRIKSPEFEIAGYKLRVDVYPKFTCLPGFTGICLRNKNDVDLTASFTLEVHFLRINSYMNHF